jgi:hypothetical protein
MEFFKSFFHMRNCTNVDFLPGTSTSARNADPEQHRHFHAFDQTQRVGNASVRGHVMFNGQTVPNATVSVGSWLSQDAVFSTTVLDQASVNWLSPLLAGTALLASFGFRGIGSDLRDLLQITRLAPPPQGHRTRERDPEAQIVQGLLVGGR